MIYNSAQKLTQDNVQLIQDCILLYILDFRKLRCVISRVDVFAAFGAKIKVYCWQNRSAAYFVSNFAKLAFLLNSSRFFYP